MPPWYAALSAPVFAGPEAAFTVALVAATAAAALAPVLAGPEAAAFTVALVAAALSAPVFAGPEAAFTVALVAATAAAPLAPVLAGPEAAPVIAAFAALVTAALLAAALFPAGRCALALAQFAHLAPQSANFLALLVERVLQLAQHGEQLARVDKFLVVLALFGVEFGVLVDLLALQVGQNASHGFGSLRRGACLSPWGASFGASVCCSAAICSVCGSLSVWC